MPPSPPLLTTTFKLLGTSQNKKQRYVIVSMVSEPVNLLTASMWTELLSTLTSLEGDASVRGLILHSGLRRNVFSAGNDIRELHVPSTSASQFQRFWETQTTFLARLYRTRLFTIAAIRGSCPAGGCAIALCCDYRIMDRSSVSPCIGLNEVALGIPVPKYWSQLMCRVMGSVAVAEGFLCAGRLLTASEAIDTRLVHQLADASLLGADADAMMEKVLSVPDEGRVLTKLSLRDAFSREWESYGGEEARVSFEMLQNPRVVEVLDRVMKRLNAKL